jgi:hypothetical protein
MTESVCGRFAFAEYKDPGLQEYAENPLISALPLIMSPAEAAANLKKIPTFKNEEMALPGHIRVHAISRLTRNFFVPQTLHLILEQRISLLIRKSYLGRNPNFADFKRKLNTTRDFIKTLDLTSYVHDGINSPASSMTIAGISGAGKSTAINIILNTYPKVLYHPDHKLLQVPWIKVDCPYDGALSDFCRSFFIALDKRLNTNYRGKYTSGKVSIGNMVADVANLCLIHAIGLIVIDEFQHMNLAKSGGEKKMINFLVTLVNVVEVSVIFIGTPKALSLFSSEFRQARRATGEGSLIWDRLPFDECWDEFLEELWPYQWLQSAKPLDESIRLRLYELSQGIPDIVVKILCLAQARAILLADCPSDEYLSIELIEDVFEDELSIVKPLLEALSSKNERALQKCGDIVIPKIESALLNTFDHLKPKSINSRVNLELGSPEHTDVAKAALDVLTGMGISDDIANPLLNEIIISNPDITLIQVIQLATSTLSGLSDTPELKKKEKQNTIVKRDAWGRLDSGDLRKLYADKTGSMYEELEGQGFIYPQEVLLAS